jgi:hypothetical protein
MRYTPWLGANPTRDGELSEWRPHGQNLKKKSSGNAINRVVGLSM